MKQAPARKGIRPPAGLDIVGATPRMRRVLRLIEKIAPTESTVLITGESGTGKELVAGAIHQLSKRAEAVFLAVNAGALPDQLIESELFGHVRGAFTGADRERRGLFEQAAGGTLFLDEVAEMAPHLQVSLLRVLESGEIRPVGSSETRPVDVRVIAATNQDPLAAVRRGVLREDLFFRLNVFHLELPPLRERSEDIPILAAYFTERYSRALGKQVTRFSPDAQVALMRYDYPGNVRELEHAIERAVVLAESDTITLEDLPPSLSTGQTLLLPGSRGSAMAARGGAASSEERAAASAAARKSAAAVESWGASDGTPAGGFDVGYPPSWSLRDVERAHIERVLADLQGNISLSARRLGISRTTLWRKLKQHGITVRRGKDGGPSS
jgi:DNA-binding NtrC family response regulator